ncbi:hypothetical protein FC85_GL002455 [Lentilactobacillus diolivorans DSM 14421]|uniref:HTH marR-type domain-containing protein n=1 Tax=Lentilactobacillus diolivorans DSM 14421 TaxID=1423739 RepID=A0A0R1SPK2_9LACO|nr:hypothetical protein FC85_GL002455 [Lentilactobacillus diolivorans DSM 14421]
MFWDKEEEFLNNQSEMLLSVINRLVRNQITHLLSSVDLSDNNFMLIVKIHDNPGLSQKMLVHQIYRNHSIITKQLAKLKKLKFVDVVVNPKNKREKQIFLTNKGESAYLEIVRVSPIVNKWIVEGLTENEAAQFTKLLKKIFENKKDMIDRFLLD